MNIKSIINFIFFWRKEKNNKDTSTMVFPESFKKRKIGYTVIIGEHSADKFYIVNSDEELKKFGNEVDKDLTEITTALNNSSDSQYINCLGHVFKKSDFKKISYFNYEIK